MERAWHREPSDLKIVVNAVPIDLEYLQFVDLDDPESKRLVDATIDADLGQLTKQSLYVRKNTLVLGTILWEHSVDKKIIKNLRYFQDKCQSIDVRNHFLVGLEKKTILADFDNCTFIDFFLLRSYYEGYCREQILNEEWQSENKKFLFLMGKPLKPHRIGLLYRFYKQSMLDHDRAIWSFYNKISTDDCKKYVPKDTDTQDLEIFLNNYQQSPDGVYSVHNHYGGFPFDPTLYKNTNLSVVSETHSYSVPWNTEKTYKAILNNHPFLIAGARYHTQHLVDAGYETFDQYFAVPDYSSIADLNTRLDAIVENVKKFNPTAEQKEKIHQATKRNVLQLNKSAKNYIHTINTVLSGHGISQPWTAVLPLKDQYFSTWQYHYQQIKDPTWPPCASLLDCVNLPIEIQQELRTKFNLDF